ncbi:methyltransferase [Paenibacillus apiarius]|uniref:Methyltransferase n=1 Tax=Paenibacillus apiarius TaxID=46240 RepID=A0ABT4DXJ9_9BACL|nr:methyltransferase [Paenibacillus apiarius]MCY9515888.1 hypothetical protein [Paenibacillus apiarius]MCY9520798.1 hypothetical protein [Paenibacillus apiarius]MCY9553502.1 hypothetical protein [Paenibacillus apiarius]MCY9557974.1 hypothetical protein [Paenibacillus apiarius]MCY9685829.1 hypothetical protein [Paenibacillus apiarius]
MSIAVSKQLNDSERLLRMFAGSLISQTVYAVTELRIPDLLAEGPRTCQELAALTQTEASMLYRTMRFLCDEDIFRETEEQTFELGPLGPLLRSDMPDSLYAHALMYGQPWHSQPAGHFLESLTKGISAFEVKYGTNVFSYLAKHPEAELIFQNSMTAYSRSIIPSILSAYDFSPFDTVVDIGGGHGILMEQLLTSCTQAKGIVFDQPAVIEGTTQFMKQSGLEERCVCVGGNFFEAVPEGGDAYMMKHIIHDWSDEESVSILSNCRSVMKKDGKLLLFEIVLGSGNEAHFGKLLDMEMLAMSTGKERTQAEYERLFQQSGFRLNRIVPTSTHVSIIEGVPK